MSAWLTEILSDFDRASAIRVRLAASPKTSRGAYCMLRPEDAEMAIGVPFAKLRECVPVCRISKRTARISVEHLIAVLTYGSAWTFAEMIPGSSALHAKEGSVYFVEAVGCDRIKIGFTSGTVVGRVAKLQTSSPFALSAYGSVPGSAALEAALHIAFTHERVMPNAEWFHMRGSLMPTIDMLIDHANILAKPADAPESVTWRAHAWSNDQ